MKKFSVILSLMMMLILVACDRDHYEPLADKFVPIEIKSSNVEFSKDQKNEFHAYAQIPASGQTIQYTLDWQYPEEQPYKYFPVVSINGEYVSDINVNNPDCPEGMCIVFANDDYQILQNSEYPYTTEVKINENSSKEKREITLYYESFLSYRYITLTQEAE